MDWSPPGSSVHGISQARTLEWVVISFSRDLSNPGIELTVPSQVVLVVKNLPANAGDKRDLSLIPGLGRSSGGGHGNPLQYSCPENPMDGGV